MAKNYASAKKADSLQLHEFIVLVAGLCTFVSGVYDWKLMPAVWLFIALSAVFVAWYIFLTFGLGNNWQPRLCVTLDGARRYYEGSDSYYFQPASFGLRLLFFPEPIESGHREIQEVDDREVSLSTSEYMNIYILGYNADTVGSVLDTAVLYSWPIVDGRVTESSLLQFSDNYLQPAFETSETLARSTALTGGLTLRFHEMVPA